MVQIQIGESEEVQNVFVASPDDLATLILRLKTTENTVLNVQGLGPVTLCDEYIATLDTEEGLNFGKKD
jgi:hypothetical protein